ncbi:hypothetical protein N7533_004930 [Penicillium manginii]|uniref:uncharacterized protein n=1 Tax=Penicillium manginii TaxID=203109 RepID=UPI002547A0A4|nr:uncharacterized protein N7533_004930 [Penicillium manginii]KAJ5755387.1 hypothetical protein N7533_004930 [Penicillium manginii]
MTDKRAIDPTEISWSDELGDTPFFHATYLDPDESSNKVIASQSNRRPIGWILEQLTGRVEVEFLIVYSPDESISRAFDPEFLKQIAPETFSMILDDDEENL